MRPVCLFCVSKHIAQAIVLVTEATLGYPEHIWLAVGHLAEAETESVSEFPELADKIREVRLALMGQEGTFQHDSLMTLLKLARNEAEIINGISERERVRDILFPTPKPLIKLSPKKQIKSFSGMSEEEEEASSL